MHSVGPVLAVVAALAVLGDCKSRQRAEGQLPPEEASTSVASVSTMPRIPELRQAPAFDLPTERLSERVDGASVKLQALGCERLRGWRLRSLSAEVERFSFSTARGAAAYLEEQAGAERFSDVPGDEGWRGVNALYFRRGREYVRLVADTAVPQETLIAVARAVDQILQEGQVNR